MNASVAALDIPGTFNARAVTPGGELVRAANLDSITAEGVVALTRLGVSEVIDLREAAERGEVRHEVPVRHIPLFGTGAPPRTGSLEALYDDLLIGRAAALGRAVAAIADAPGTVLVHCAVGKDRTGLVVALTLLAAGSDSEDVVEDYVLSAEHVAANYADHASAALAGLALSPEQYEAALRLQLDAPHTAIRHAVATLDALGGAFAYLARAGVDEQRLEALRQRFGSAL